MKSTRAATCASTLLAFMAALLLAVGARAQPKPDPASKAVGDELYLQAREARVAKDYATCHAKAAASIAAHPYPPTAGLLGDCALELGRYREAAEHLSAAIADPRRSSSKIVEHWQARLAEAQRHLATVRVTVSIEDAECTADGARIAKLPATLYLEPGQHVFEATHPERDPDRREMALSAGASVDVPLDPKERAPAPQSDPNPSTGNGDNGVPGFAIAAGVSGAFALGGIALTVAAAVLHADAYDEVDSLGAGIAPSSACGSATPPAQCGALSDALDDEGTYRTIFPVGLAVTGVATALTATFLILHFTASDSATSVTVVPSFAGAQLHVRF
jgi:hypothetical protein